MVRLLDALMPELGAAMTGVFAESSAAGRDFDRVAEALGGIENSVGKLPRRKQRRPCHSSRLQPKGRFTRTYRMATITKAA